MGRFGIGARVTDGDGDTGIIVGKSKGFRDVKFENGMANGLTVFGIQKAALTVAANDNIDGIDPGGEQPASLSIEAGKLYCTRDGRKIGPMVRRTVDTSGQPYTGDFIWSDGDHATGGPDRTWQADGHQFYTGDTDPSDLIGEWIEPAVTQEPDDVAAGPTLEEWFIGALVGRTFRMRVASPSERYIICLVDRGQPLPSARPHVHRDRAAADLEQDRLARKHPGKEFAVYRRVSTVKADVSLRRVS